MEHDYEPLRLKNKEKSRKSCVCIGVSVFVLLIAAIALVVLGIFFWNSKKSLNETHSQNSTHETYLVEVGNNKISFEATMRLSLKAEENKARRSIDCDDAKSKLKDACSSTSDLKTCETDKLKEYLEDYMSNNLINELKSSSDVDASINRFKSVNIEIELFNVKTLSVDTKAKITILYERIVADNETESGIKVETIIERLDDSFDRCSNHLQVSNIKLGDESYTAYKQYKMVEGFIGNWKMTSSENFDKILEHFGVNYFLRKLATSQNPSGKIEYNERTNKWSIILSTSFKTVKREFEIGKEFNDETPDGRKVKSTFLCEEKKFIHTERDYKGNVLTVVTIVLVNDDEHWELFKAGDVTAKRVFNRIK